MTRLTSAILTLLIALVAVVAVGVTPAVASTGQQAIFEDDGLLHQNPTVTLADIRALGATRVRVFISWASIAPSPHARRAPRGFDGSSPGAYPARNWSFYDQVVRQAQADGLGVDFLLSAPAPQWAEGAGEPRNGPFGVWKPNPAAFGAFVKAIATRYDGHYTPRGATAPLPRVGFWEIWNEPNYGPDLAPQATDHDTVELSPAIYRSLLDSAWAGLHASGHGHDTILFGSTAPHGLLHPIGNFSGMYPLRFLRALYCVDASLHPLRGAAATQRSCPATSGGSRRFRAQHPALFGASAFAAHPYTEGTPPNRPFNFVHDSADLANLPSLERTLDGAARAYGSGRRLPIFSTEYGYQTSPPEHVPKVVSPATAAVYLNWAEYIGYKDPRVQSYAQYLLQDPAKGNFASGLVLPDGKVLPTYAAYMMPLYLPTTSGSPGTALEVWGGVRPAQFVQLDTGAAQQAQLQFQADSQASFTTLNTITLASSNGYFDVHQRFPGSGTVRIAWTDPRGVTHYSRSVKLILH
jgi:hypothetical protein